MFRNKLAETNSRKITEIQQRFAHLEKQVHTLGEKILAQNSDNSRNLLEFAELGEKMRRTYLRLSRIVKVDSQAQEANEQVNGESIEDRESDPRSIRENINRSLGL